VEYSERDKERFKEEFGIRRKRQLMATIPFLLVFVCLLSSNRETGEILGIPALIWGSIAGAAVVGMVVFSFFNRRCPACDKYLGKGFGPRFCPRCGVQLRD
jgi:hypothetical protein